MSAVIVSGEALDSDSEEEGCDAVEELNKTEPAPIKPVKNTCEEKHSLLHQRLKESNAAFYGALEANVRSIVEGNKKALEDIDQQILRSQLKIQGAVTILKQLSAQSEQLKNKTNDLLSSNWLPSTKITKSDHSCQ